MKDLELEIMKHRLKKVETLSTQQKEEHDMNMQYHVLINYLGRAEFK